MQPCLAALLVAGAGRSVCCHSVFSLLVSEVLATRTDKASSSGTNTRQTDKFYNSA